MATEVNLFSGSDFHQGDILEEELFPPDSPPREQSVFGGELLDYLQHNAESPLLETCLEEIAEHWRNGAEVQEIVRKDPNVAAFAEFPLKDCEQLPEGTTDLSTMEILRAATKKHVLTPTDATSNGSLQQVELLMAAAEKIGCRKFDEAHVLLDYCDQCSSDSRNPVERLVFHFCSALRERIHQDDAPSSRVPINCFVTRRSRNMR
ncbi:hypothetical protein MLD38_020572 [Melastoma candidum]|uniref:Uncharacterized protein n=1 Tax=Melastoma candidum TaxID=119954 RepID=A0ACB9QH56_9MYRT|nr:hypothetical protein MLD38_020572 [Melastoma candidum]